MIKHPSIKDLKKEGKYEEIRWKCAFCDIKDQCPSRARKERYESDTFMTFCPFTPNGRGRKKTRV